MFNGYHSLDEMIEDVKIKEGDTITVVYDIKDVGLKEEIEDVAPIPNYDFRSDPEWHVL